MKPHQKIMGAGLIVTGLLSIGGTLIPSSRTNDQAYYFDYKMSVHDTRDKSEGQVTIMIPRCEKTENREGCANSWVGAVYYAEQRAKEISTNLKTERVATGGHGQ